MGAERRQTVGRRQVITAAAGLAAGGAVAGCAGSAPPPPGPPTEAPRRFAGRPPDRCGLGGHRARSGVRRPGRRRHGIREPGGRGHPAHRGPVRRPDRRVHAHRLHRRQGGRRPHRMPLPRQPLPPRRHRGGRPRAAGRSRRVPSRSSTGPLCCPEHSRQRPVTAVTSFVTRSTPSTTRCLPGPSAGHVGGVMQQFGQYRIEGIIGSGGMGEVFRAYDTRRDREVALKLLPTALLGRSGVPAPLPARVLCGRPAARAARHPDPRLR